MVFYSNLFGEYHIVFLKFIVCLCRIKDREKQLSILYQKQGRATQFASKAARDQWLKKEIRDYEQVLSSNLSQVILLVML